MDVKHGVLLKRSCTKPASLGTTVFVECFPVAGEKVLSHYSITVNRCLYLIIIVSERRLLFWRKMLISNNIVLAVLSRGIVSKFVAVGSLEFLRGLYPQQKSSY